MRLAPHVDFHVEATAVDDEHITLTVNGHQVALLDPKDLSDMERAGRVLTNELVDRLYGPRER